MSSISSVTLQRHRIQIPVALPASMLTWQYAFLWVVAGCQAASLLVSWSLWQVHEAPPMLPALPLPQFDLGVVMLASLLGVVAVPRFGVPAHTVLLAYAMLMDQTRLQPEFISLGLLLWGGLPYQSAMTLARAHLVSMWIFAGLNKLLSPAFMHGSAQWMLGAAPGRPPLWLFENFGYVVVVAEASLGILSIFPRTRRLAAVLIFVVHASIFLILSPWGHKWNEVVWPWNVALALSGFVLILPWKESVLESLRRCPRAVAVGVVALALAPAGFYLLVVDAYAAHNLYTNNTPVESWCDAQNRCTSGVQVQSTWKAFNVPLPPEHRLFEQYFQSSCKPGERLMIRDTRLLARYLGLDQRSIPCQT